MLKPLPAERWNHAAATHLLARAGFGGSPGSVARLAAQKHAAAVDSLVHFDPVKDPFPPPPWAQPDPTRAERLRTYRQASPEKRQELQREERRLQQDRLLSLREWWLQRMTLGPQPLQEKLALFWHGHFATSMEKVRDAYLMWRQNQTFRELGAATWPSLLEAASKDPAMLIWLDQAQSRRSHPNENFARELLELFALGEGHYSEKDVAEAARALTGWSLDASRQSFAFRPRQHDPGSKTVLDQTGPWKGEDIVRQVATSRQSSLWVTGKLWYFFAGQPPATAWQQQLADRFHAHGQSFRPWLREIFLSEAFYATDLVRAQVKSPVQWLVGTVQALECPLPPAPASSQALRLLGQDLFAPPNVKGWEGGLSWINASSLMNRYQLAAYLVSGELAPSARPARATNDMNRPRRARRNRQAQALRVEPLLTPEERRDPELAISALSRRLLGMPLGVAQRRSIDEFLAARSPLDDADLRHVIRLILCTPEFQLT